MYHKAKAEQMHDVYAIKQTILLISSGTSHLNRIQVDIQFIPASKNTQQCICISSSINTDKLVWTPCFSEHTNILFLLP